MSAEAFQFLNRTNRCSDTIIAGRCSPLLRRFNSSIGLTAVLTIQPTVRDYVSSSMFQFLNRTNRCSDLVLNAIGSNIEQFQFLNRTNRCSDTARANPGWVDKFVFQFLNRTNRCSDRRGSIVALQAAES